MSHDNAPSESQRNAPIMALASVIFLIVLVRVSLLIQIPLNEALTKWGLAGTLIGLGGFIETLGNLIGLLTAIFLGARKTILLVSVLLPVTLLVIVMAASKEFTVGGILGTYLATGALTILPVLALMNSGTVKQIGIGIPLLAMSHFLAVGFLSWFSLWAVFSLNSLDWFWFLVPKGSAMNQVVVTFQLLMFAGAIGIALGSFRILVGATGDRPIAVYAKAMRGQAWRDNTAFLSRPINYLPILATVLLTLTAADYARDSLRVEPLFYLAVDTFRWRLVDNNTILFLTMGIGGLLGIFLLRPWQRRSAIPLAMTVSLIAAILVFGLNAFVRSTAFLESGGFPNSAFEAIWQPLLAAAAPVSLGTALSLSWLATAQIGRKTPLAALLAVVVFTKLLVPIGLDELGISGAKLAHAAPAMAFGALLVGYIYIRLFPTTWLLSEPERPSIPPPNTRDVDNF